jgi:uncharacterized protein YbbC (DUF1343 family)
MVTWPMISARGLRLIFPLLFIVTSLQAFSDSREFRLGRDRLFAEEYDLVKGKSIGFFGNRTTLGTLDRLIDDPGVTVAKIFVPEHGLNAAVRAGETVDDARYRGIPVISAYGPGKRKIDPRELDGLDSLVFEIQDIGTRHYTYLTTLYLQMTACSQASLPFILLDRPNGGGDMVEGPLLDPSFQSYIGLFGPNAHGMTQGELAGLFIGERDFMDGDRYDRDGEYSAIDGLELHVVKMANYEREKGLWQQGFDPEEWIAPSPNIPTPLSALCYKGSGLFDGYEIGEIVRNYREQGLAQFQNIQLPRIRNRDEVLYFVDRCYDNWSFPGLQLEPVKNENTGDWDILQYRITDREMFHSTLAALAILYTWEEVYHPGSESGFTDRARFDKAIGNSWLSGMLTSNQMPSFAELLGKIRADEARFNIIRSRYLLY